MSYDDIQDQIDEGRQMAADELGPPYDVYRMQNPDSTGSVLIAANKIASLVSVFCKVAYGGLMRISLETEKNQGVIWYELVADMSPFKVGDVFVLNDPVYGQGASSVNYASNEFKGFALADHSPIKKCLGGRLNTTVTIQRPATAVDTSGQWDWNPADSQPLVLSNGVFSLGAVGVTPTKVPAGLIASGKSYGSQMFSQVPGAERKSGWELYLPALNGFTVHEGDIVVDADGARYIVVVPYTQRVGASGSQWFLEREAPGA